MAHSLTPSPAAPTVPISTRAKKKSPSLVLEFYRQWDGHQAPDKTLACIPSIGRRAFVLSLSGGMLAASLGGQAANAAARRPPPPPTEKKDPNVSGVQAKILASKKRKEAMEQAMAKLREKGKPINPSPPPPPPPQ